MPFHFKRKERIAKAVRRLCCERIDAALKNLRHSDRARSVHDVRKEIKKLRAVLRLVRDGIGKKDYRKCNDLLRVAADCLTGIRDAHVKLSALKELVGSRGKPSSFPGIKSALQQNSRYQKRKFLETNSAKMVKEILCRLWKRVKDLEPDADGWPAIAPGLTKSFCCGQQALAEVRKNPTSENFHEWRKRVKDLWYNLRLLCPTWPQELEMVTTQLEELSEFLGDDHDLVMLAEFVAEGRFPAAEEEPLNRLIATQQKELRSAALKSGGRFYAVPPEHLCNRFSSYWKIWRNK